MNVLLGHEAEIIIIIISKRKRKKGENKAKGEHTAWEGITDASSSLTGSLTAGYEPGNGGSLKSISGNGLHEADDTNGGLITHRESLPGYWARIPQRPWQWTEMMGGQPKDTQPRVSFLY